MRKMESLKIITGKTIKATIMSLLFSLVALFDIIIISGKTSVTDTSIWGAANIWVTNSDLFPGVCFIFIILFFVNIVSAVVGIILGILSQKAHVWPFTVLIATHAAMITLNINFEVIDNSAFIILSIVLAVIGIAYALLCGLVNREPSVGKVSGGGNTKLKKALSVTSLISVIPALCLFYIPICTYYIGETKYSLIPMAAFSSAQDNLLCLVFFIVLLAASVLNLTMLIDCFKHYSGDEAVFADKARGLVIFNTALTGLYFVVGVALCSVNNSIGGNFYTACYIPFVIMAAISIVCAVITRGFVADDGQAITKTAKFARIEFLIYGSLASIITVFAALSDIITVDVTNPSIISDIQINGYDILMNYNTAASGFQLVAFILFAVIAATVALFLASLISFISRSKLFFRITLAELVFGAAASMAVGLFGKYYEIVQRLNTDLINEIIATHVGTEQSIFEYTVHSQAFNWFLLCAVVLIAALIRKPYSKGTIGETTVSLNGVASRRRGTAAPARAAGAVAADFSVADPCPAFTELDNKAELFAEQTQMRSAAAFEAPTLPKLVQFVVNYARDSRLHLSYTTEDIATFIAGLGATRLSILQGMSGTGKTSLPKIFSEAIMGNCEIIEVESSWRDKNELLGYYNEFSKTYTPKKFTQALYKAKLNPETMTFIVLDEMNLSRIEYYFSDFLSLMENEEDKREIKLLNVGLYRTEDGNAYTYSGLDDGHTIKIPNNIWFIGTANRDESTFEISDKVYDRAHTMNFNKRAAKPLAYGAPIPQRYISVDAFMQLLEKAKSSVRFDIDNYPLIREVEALLAPYNISFGNRIAKQMETFVSIYCSCFASADSVVADAVEKILLSKVVSKLEFKSVENKAQLAAEFEKRNLHRCSEFILKLNED